MTPELWKQIEELYHASVDQEPEIRDSLLAKASSEVRGAVYRLLSQDTAAILDRPAWEGETTLSISSHSISPGSTLGPYRIEARVGAGGMGEVFRASDSRLGRKVAIKAIRGGRSAGGLELRFLEEARAASALNHPNIITIYDVGAAEGQPYIVMEWIDGHTLRQKLTQGPLPISEVLGIAAQILDALAAAHEGGIIHRDLKPENIMVNAAGRAKVLDFGIAKRTVMPGDPTGVRTISRSGRWALRAICRRSRPEAKNSISVPITFRSGQCSMNWRPAGRAFAGDSVADVQAAILLRQPEPLTSLNPQAPAPLQWIVERCLAKSSRDRFESTEELRRQLSAIVARVGPACSGRALSQQHSRAANRFDRARRGTRSPGGLDCRSRSSHPYADGPGGNRQDQAGGGTRPADGGSFRRRGVFRAARKGGRGQSGAVRSGYGSGRHSELAGVDAEAAIASHLRQLAGPVFLILDNFEHVLEAALFVARLASDRLKVVVTSRAALRVYGEYEFAVPSLDSGLGQRARADGWSPAVDCFWNARQVCAAPRTTRSNCGSWRRSVPGWTGCHWRSSWPPPAPGCFRSRRCRLVWTILWPCLWAGLAICRSVSTRCARRSTGVITCSMRNIGSCSGAWPFSWAGPPSRLSRQSAIRVRI